VFFGDGRVENEKENDERRWGESSMRNWDLRKYHV